MEYGVCGMFSFMRLLAVLKPLKFSVQLVFFFLLVILLSIFYSLFILLFLYFLTNVQLTLDWRTINTISINLLVVIIISSSSRRRLRDGLATHHIATWQLPLATLLCTPIPITRIKPSACCNSVKIRKFTDAPVDRQPQIHPYIHLYIQAPLATLPHLPQSMLCSKMYRLFYLTLTTPPKATRHQASGLTAL